MRILRKNDRCSCNSGRKFKRCCGVSSAEKPSASSYEDLVFTEGSEGILNMPAVILKLAEPFLEGADSLQSQESLFVLVVLAWNFSILIDMGVDFNLESFFNKHFPEEIDSSPIQEFVQTIIRRKKKFFPQSRRLIIGLELMVTDSGDNLRVTSSLIPDDVDVREFERDLMEFLG